MNEERLQGICEQVEREYQMGGLSDGIYGDFAKEVAKRAVREASSEALGFALRFGGFESADNKAWVIDQMSRALLGDAYGQFVANARAGAEGPETYSWDTGIAP